MDINAYNKKKTKTMRLKRLVPLALMVFAAFNYYMEGSYDELARQEMEEDNIGRSLQIAVNPSDYYDPVGEGSCLDNAGRQYDWQYIDKKMYVMEDCCKMCARRVLMEEHVGFMYDHVDFLCYCLWDNDEMPARFANKGNVTFEGSGPIVTSDGDAESNLKCYKKRESQLPNALDSYDASTCTEGDDQNIDVATWSNIASLEECAKKCQRFTLYSFHVGLEYDPNVLSCDCQFLEGEAPHVRVLPKSSERKTKITKKDLRAKRKKDKGGNVAESALPEICLSKKGYEEPDQSLRIDPTGLGSNQKKVWINEIHYRNQGPDTPFIEVVGPYNFDPNGYKVVLYQARNGRQFSDSYDLSDDTILLNMNEHNGWGFHIIDIEARKIRKGKMGGDGVALIYNDFECVQFFSYTHSGVNHTFKANTGPCKDIVTTPMGVAEGRKTPEYQSLQLTGGPGSDYSAFTWVGPLNSTIGTVNVGQVLDPIP